jgi:hypothetical protein
MLVLVTNCSGRKTPLSGVEGAPKKEKSAREGKSKERDGLTYRT